MPLDAITVKALSRELEKAAAGSKIDKVQQPERDTVILSLRGSGQNLKLLIAAGTDTARAHISTQVYENPQSPPMFCMLLRKHLVGARIVHILQPDMERMLCMELDAFDEMGSPTKKWLILELMGRNSNIILLGEDGHIIDCMRRVDGDMSRMRQVLPGLFYHMPPKQGKPEFFELSNSQREELWKTADEGKLTDKWLLDSFSGLSPLICRELSYNAADDASVQIGRLSPAQRENILLEMNALAARVSAGDFQPCMLLKEDSPMDFSFMPIQQYESTADIVPYSDFSSLLEDFFTRKAKREQMRRKSQSLYKFVTNAHERSLRKLAARREELAKTDQREVSKLYGELITANLYLMRKGDKSLVAANYYEEESPVVTIPLDPQKTPQQNAAKYFKEYNKAKTAEKYLGDLIKKGETEEAYLLSVMDAIERAESDRDLAEIRNELVETGFIKKQKTSKREKIKESPFLCFYSTAGLPIYVGKNNVQNDKLTMKTARRSDLWLHARNTQGSHVIISCNGEEPDERTLFEAATLTAYFSQAREGTKVPVDYTRVCKVKKPTGALPGMVIYSDSKTIFVEPDEKLVQSLKSK